MDYENQLKFPHDSIPPIYPLQNVSAVVTCENECCENLQKFEAERLRSEKEPLILYYSKHERDRNVANPLILSEVYILYG